MGFFFRTVEADPSCTSQVLVDGRYPSVDSLVVKRATAVVDLFPCQSLCCSGPYPSNLVYKVPPLKLNVRLTATATVHTFDFSLSRKGRILRRVCDVLPLPTAHPLYALDVRVRRHTGAIHIAVLLAGRPVRAYDFVDDLRAHSSADVAFYIGPAAAGLCDAAMARSGSDRWLCIELFRSRDREISPHGIFDDRAPAADRFGDVFWKGFEEPQKVTLRAVSVWSCKGIIAGLQACYDINGVIMAGPRHLHVADSVDISEEAFSLTPGEDITTLILFLLPQGLCSQISFETNKQRRYTVGSMNSNSLNGKQETVSLTPQSRIVAFRGAAEGDGLRNFGIVVERSSNKIASVTLSEMDTCMVCGANKKYFKDHVDFRKHLETCKKIRAAGTRFCVQTPAL